MEVRDETVVADPEWVPPAMWIGFPVLGAGLGWLLVSISDWVALVTCLELGTRGQLVVRAGS